MASLSAHCQTPGWTLPRVLIQQLRNSAENAFRRAGVPMQGTRPSIDWLLDNVGPHALASRDLYTDGAEVLWDFAQRSGEGSADDRVVKRLIVPRSGQYVFKDIVQHYLQQIRFEENKYARMIGLPQFGGANVVLDPSITGRVIPTAILMVQGHTRRMDFRTLMVGAVELGIVRSRSFDDYKNGLTVSLN
jgi:hypothetical protein